MHWLLERNGCKSEHFCWPLGTDLVVIVGSGALEPKESGGLLQNVVCSWSWCGYALSTEFPQFTWAKSHEKAGGFESLSNLRNSFMKLCS